MQILIQEKEKKIRIPWLNKGLMKVTKLDWEKPPVSPLSCFMCQETVTL